MAEKKNQKEGRKINNHTTLDYLKLALIIFLVVGLGLFAVNQFLNLRYKAIFLSTPCDLCAELNPHLGDCFNNELSIRINPYAIEIKDINFSNISSVG